MNLGKALPACVTACMAKMGTKVTELGTTSDSGGKATLPLGTYTLKCEAVPAGYLQKFSHGDADFAD